MMLEADLDLFNIVAVSDFNMGAMENKSLNVFNSRLILASKETASDVDFNRIEGVVAHEVSAGERRPWRAHTNPPTVARAPTHHRLRPASLRGAVPTTTRAPTHLAH